MKILSIGTDRKLFVHGSAVAKRQIEYAQALGEMHIIVFAKRELGFSYVQIAPNVFLYPTNSSSRFGYLSDAYKLGKGILSQVYFGPTVLTTQDPFETGFVGVLLRKFSKLPLQIQIHTDLWSTEFRYHTLLNWIRVTFFASFVLRRASQVRVVSQKIGQDVIVNVKLPWKRVFVLPVFVDVMQYADTPIIKDLHTTYSDLSLIVLMASRLTKEKNIRLALRAFKRVVKRYPKAGLVIVGDGPERTKLERFVRFHRLSRNVRFEPWQKDMISYMKTTDIFLNTSNYEGYGMTMIEAGAAGCALITTRVGVGQDFLVDGRNALICSPHDEDCIFSKLAILVENNHMRKVLGEELQKNILATAQTKEAYLQSMKAGFDTLFDSHS